MDTNSHKNKSNQIKVTKSSSNFKIEISMVRINYVN